DESRIETRVSESACLYQRTNRLMRPIWDPHTGPPHFHFLKESMTPHRAYRSLTLERRRSGQAVLDLVHSVRWSDGPERQGHVPSCRDTRGAPRNPCGISSMPPPALR